MDIRPTHAARYTRVCNPELGHELFSQWIDQSTHTLSVPPDTYGNYNSLFYHQQQQ